jgi:[ribosomal protein S18]-alanine N-acetyltransferase
MPTTLPGSLATEVRLEPLSTALLDAVVALEQAAHSHPWTRRHFEDILHAPYVAQTLWADDELLGYFVAMPGVDEVHLLNIAVAPAHQRCGWAQTLLDALVLWARGLRASVLWLEVRHSNSRAIAVYQRHGFASVGVRKNYYPAADGQREDAWVMRRDTDVAAGAEPDTGPHA